MKQHFALISCITTLLPPATTTLAQDETDITLELITAQHNDIDFTTATHSLGVKAKTPYGLVLCNYAKESGKTRIDTFDDIFGISSILTASWKDYDANRLQCGYGLKLPLAGGELSGGIGLMRYQGETSVMPAGKEIELHATSLQAKYVHANTTTRMNLVDSHYGFLYHNLGALNYDSDTRGHVRKVNLSGEWGPVYAEGEDLIGSKERIFTTPLFPYADVNYQQTTLSLGPLFNNGIGPLRYLAPTYITGSVSGSFNELQLNEGIRGAIAGMKLGATTLRLSYLNLQSAGSRDYSPITNDLVEAKRSSSLALELENEKWDVKLENNRLHHDGYITATNVPYTIIVGCGPAPCDYNNVREEGEWKLSWHYTYSPRIGLLGEFYNRARTDRQYELAEHKYSESGDNLGLAITF
jgi:hypothetical protein